MPKRKAIASREFEAPYVRVRGRVSRKGKVTWSPCIRSARFPAAFADPLPGASYRVVIEGRKGEELESARVDVQFVNVDPAWATFVARLPYRSEARAVALYQREKKLGALAVPKDEPRFHLLHPLESREIDPEACLHLRWKSVSKTPLTFHVRFTADDKKWLRLAVNLQQDDYVLDLRTLPGGRRCRIQIVATNGYRTHCVDVPPFALMQKPPEILLGDARGPLLFAQGFSYEQGPIAGDAIAWLSDGRGIARGGRFDARTLGRGVHELAVSLTVSGRERARQVLGPYDGATGRRVELHRR